MERGAKKPFVSPLNLLQNNENKASPRSHEALNSYRLSVASTGVADGQTSFLHSPEATHRSLKLSSSKDPSSIEQQSPRSSTFGQPQRSAEKKDVLRRVIRVRGELPLEEQQGNTLLSPTLVYAKEHGKALPPLKETCISLLHDDIQRMHLLLERVDRAPF